MSGFSAVAELLDEPVPYTENRLGPIVVDDPISVQTLRKCSVETVITQALSCKLTDPRTGDPLDGWIIIFQFRIAGHEEKVRLTWLNIDVTLEEAAGEGSATSDVKLAIKEVYPRWMHGSPSSKEITNSLSGGVQAGYDAANASVNVGRDTKRTETRCLKLTYKRQHLQQITWKLSEDPNDKNGLPEELNAALLLVTGTAPYQLQITFRGEESRRMLKKNGFALLDITPESLRETFATRQDDEITGLNDVQSQTFQKWITEQTKNSWAYARSDP